MRTNIENVLYLQFIIFRIEYYSTPFIQSAVFCSLVYFLLQFVNDHFVNKIIGLCVHAYCVKIVKIFLA